MSKKGLKVVLWVCVLIAIITIGSYILNFSSDQLSSRPSDWGTFGDYIGGILNPIIGIANIVVLVYISLLIAKYEDKRWSHELIHDAYKELIKELDKLSHKKYNLTTSNELVSYLHNFTYENSYLFDKYEKDFSSFCYDLGGSIIGVDVYVKEYIDETTNFVDLGYLNNKLLRGNITDWEEKVHLEGLSLNVSKYETQRHRMLRFIKLYIMNKDVEELVKMDVDIKAKESNHKFNKSQKEHLKMMDEKNKDFKL